MRDPRVTSNLERHARAALASVISSDLLAYGARVDALTALARELRDMGVAQRTLYSVFTERYVEESTWEDPLGDVLDLIWSGPRARGHGLFETELQGDV